VSQRTEHAMYTVMNRIPVNKGYEDDFEVVSDSNA
jgi:hypothetical protein